MTAAEARNQHADLVAKIRHHDQLYYVEARPSISDYEYDQLYQKLIELEKEHPDLVAPDSPSQRVGGAPTKGFKRIKHRQPMLSLEKIEAADHPTLSEEPDREKRNRAQDENTVEGLRAFDRDIRKKLGRDDVQYIIEPKVDGVSIGVHYENGMMTLGATRGDGQNGDDITVNLKTVRSIPLKLNDRQGACPTLLEVRGEAYMSIADFEKLNARMDEAGEKPFPNARNATAGALKQLDPKLVAQRPIRAVFYGVGVCEGVEFEQHSDMLAELRKYGLPTQSVWWVCDGIDEVLKIYREKIITDYDEGKDLRTRVPYEIDGIVLKVNTRADWAKIPAKTRSPGYAIVHKPVHWITPAETLLKAITVQVGRTGVLTPVAELEPVFVQGSTISRATLHNEDEIRRKDIRIGDTVVVRKAGMVIPEVFEVVKAKRPKDSGEFDLFKHVNGKCPACGGVIAKEKMSGGDAEEVAWRCQNVAGCPAQLTRRVEYFAARKALDIESLGGIVAEKLVERGLVKEPLDLFDLKLEQLAKLNLGTDDEPRVFGEKNAGKVIDALERAKTASLNRWIQALAISDVGETMSYEIGRMHKDMKQVAKSPLLAGIAMLGGLYDRLQVVSPYTKSNPPKDKTEGQNRKREFEAIKRQICELGDYLCEHGVAERSAKWKKLLEKGSSAIPEYLPLVDYPAAKSMESFFTSDIGKRLLERLNQLQIVPASSESAIPSPKASGIAGNAFVLTGTLPTLSRDEASKLIRGAGGNVTGSVSKNTDYVVAGESAGSKLDKAKELGIAIIDESKLLELIRS